MKIIRWVVRILFFLLLLILIVDNMTTVTMNLFGIYKLTIPLVFIMLSCIFVGVLISGTVFLYKNLKLKITIQTLEKELKLLAKTSDKI